MKKENHESINHFFQTQVTILNDGTGPQDVLNEACGADFVKVGQKAAKNFEGFVDGERCASIDGDADRLVYFYTDKSEGFVLLDGDKIATLSKFQSQYTD